MLYSSSVGPGDRVLVHGASGGVGSFAVQLAKSMGAHVTATCSHSSTAAVHALGADFVVVDVAAVAAANGDDNDKKFDRIVDLCGRSQWYPLLKPDGKLVQVALPRNDSESVPCILCGTGCSSQWSWPCCCQCLGRPKQQQKTSSTLIMRVVKADLQELMDKLADGTLRVAIRARLVGLDAVPDALMGGAAASSASSSSSTLSSDATAVGIDASPLAAVGKTVVVLSGDGGDNNDGDGGSVCSSAVLATVQPTSPEMKR